VSDRLPWDYWFDHRSWPATFIFLILVFVLWGLTYPWDYRVGEFLRSSGEALFLGLFLFLFGVLAVTLGQVEAQLWAGRLSPRGQLVHLVVRVAVSLLLVLPLGWAFAASGFLEPGRFPLVLGILWLYGTMLACFGWWVGRTGLSELGQFNLKYAGVIGLLLGSVGLPWLRGLSPYTALEYAVWGLRPAGWSPEVAVVAWVGLGALGAGAAMASYRRRGDGNGRGRRADLQGQGSEGEEERWRPST